MVLDASVFNKLKTFEDYKRADDEFQLKKQLAVSQIAKDSQLDADKLGEQAFLKASQGIPLSGQETAALRYIDAKSPTSAFNPVTGNMEVKPSLLDRAGLGNQVAGQAPRPAVNAAPAAPMSRDNANQIVDLYGGDGQPVNDAPLQPNEWDAAFQKEMNNAKNNPRLQQSIREAHAKSKLSMNEEESKSAAYADRMANSAPIISNTKDASMDAKENVLGSVPLLGNFLTSDSYQSAKQAQLDFINSILRRESGAAISTGEYKSYAKQYFPQPGDSQEVIAQKEMNRQEALKGVQRSAGPAYKAAIINSSPSNQKIKNGSIADNPQTGESLVYMDGSWKPLKGKK